MNRAEIELEYQRYLTLREQANEDWQRLARITALVAEQFMELALTLRARGSSKTVMVGTAGFEPATPRL